MPRKKATREIKTTSDLRKTLLETIQGVRSGEVDYRQGATIATLAKSVIASAKLDFEVLRFHNELEPDGRKTLKAIELSA